MLSHTHALTIIIADRLRREAERLEHVWNDPDLDPGFVSDQVLAVLRFLEKVGQQGRNRDEQAEFAAALLRGFCRRNGRRDTARAGEGRRAGLRPAFVSLDSLLAEGWDAPGTHPQADWLREEAEAEEARALPRDLTRFLEGRGWARERAWMFVWAEYDGLEWKEVAGLLEARFGVRATPAALRKWAERNWGGVRADAADFRARRLAFDDVTDHLAPGIAPLGMNSALLDVNAGMDGTHSGARSRRKEVALMGN